MIDSDTSTTRPSDQRVDRAARDGLIRQINAFLDGELTAFQFDERLQQYREEANDPTVRFVAEQLWRFYDDCKDHTVALSKEAWDYIQRLVLVLRSDGWIRVDCRRRFTWRQAFAAVGTVAFLIVALRVGLDFSLFVVAMPLLVVSLLLRGASARRELERACEGLQFAPFRSWFHLAAVYRETGCVRKRRYPRHLASKRIRGRIAEFVMLIPAWGLLLTFSPIVLLIQAIPERMGEPEAVALCD